LAEADGRRFGDNIKSLRRELALSRAALARKADLGLDTLLRLESGQSAPRLDTLLKVADALETDPGQLLRGLRERNTAKA
jgi:transcriptional regulator with XRE-family HTH domain